MPDAWTLNTPAGPHALNPTFAAPKYEPGSVAGPGVLRRDDRATYQRSGDGLPTPGPLTLTGRVWRDDQNHALMLQELEAITTAAATCTSITRANNFGRYVYDGLAGGATPEITPDGLGGWIVKLDLWPGRAEPTFLPSAVCSNFNSLPLGPGAPPGWTDRWAPGSYEVIQHAGTPDGYGPAVLDQRGSGNRLITVDALDDSGPDIEVLALGRFNGAFAGGPWARVSGAAGSENGYGVRMRTDNAAPQLVRANNGSFTTLANFNHIISGSNLWMWVRLRVVGDQIMGKTWSPNAPEPPSWGASVTDSTHSGPGCVGLGVRSGGRPWWTSMCVGFGGDTVPIDSGALT